MKTIFKTILLLSFLALTLATTQTFAQASDTLVVAAFPPGNLNTVINGDTTASGDRNNPNRVYVLQQNSAFDTTYYLTATIRVEDLTLIGKVNPVSGNIPCIAPMIREDNTSVGSFFTVPNSSAITLKNLFLLGTRTDASSVTGQCVSAGTDSCRYIMDNCIFENFGSSGTPNVLNTWNAIGTDIFLNSCLFKNNQSSTPQNPGVNWAGPGVNAIDTFIVRNCTFEVMGGNIAGSGSSIEYFEFDHNTMFMHTKSSPFSCKMQANSKITNNIFFSVYSAGLDSNHAYNEDVYNSNFFSPPAVITMDTLGIDLTGEPYYMTEQDRIVEATNNVYFWPQAVLDNFDILNGDPKYLGENGQIYAPIWVATHPGLESILTDKDTWPGINVGEDVNTHVDPGFDADLVAMAAEEMNLFVQEVWENDGTALNDKPFIYETNPVTPFVDVPANWKTTKGYPIRESLRYSNEALKTAATDGGPMGDQTWWPDLVSAVEELPGNVIPSEFALDQNYPNPFNPVTNIKYSVSNSAQVTLKVYNLLGQEVATLVNQVQKAGNYIVDFDASKLSSGVYMYRLQSGNVGITKKMMLLK